MLEAAVTASHSNFKQKTGERKWAELHSRRLSLRQKNDIAAATQGQHQRLTISNVAGT